MVNQYGSIRIETEKNDYTGGERINGRVVLALDTAILCRGINLEFNGNEVTYWTTGSGKHRTTHTQTVVHAKETEVLFGKKAQGMLFNMGDALIGIFDKSNYQTIEQGNYSYDFSFLLPEGVPADYESDGQSHIRYELNAFVDIPFAVDFGEKKRLTVFECFELPEEKSVQTEATKTFMLDSSNPLSMKVTVDNNLYYPGDFVSGSIEVDNQSSKEITEITIGLNQVRKMSANRSTTVDNNIIPIDVIKSPAISKYGTNIFNFECQIPEHVYCTIIKSKILKLNYTIQVNLDVPWAVDLDCDVPIIILEEEAFPSGLKKKKN